MKEMWAPATAVLGVADRLAEVQGSTPIAKARLVYVSFRLMLVASRAQTPKVSVPAAAPVLSQLNCAFVE